MAKDIIPAHNDLKQGNWTIRYSQNPSSFITGKNILLLGFGSIGQTIYDLLSGFRMQFYVFNRTKKLSKFAHLVRSKDELLDILPNIDFIINSLPLTKTTTNFLNQNELLQMKKSCCLVNVGRAATVHENSLYLALKQKRIKAAYFDVWYHYPSDQLTRKFTRPTNAPFHELDNFYYSPHRAGGLGIHDLEKNRALDLIHFIHCWADGKPLPNQMDLELGY
jgi:phosphoglycerate dehydrogenase-like enzyme